MLGVWTQGGEVMPRGLRADFKMTLEAQGFEEQTGADDCLYVHKQREIDLALFVMI